MAVSIGTLLAGVSEDAFQKLEALNYTVTVHGKRTHTGTTSKALTLN